MAQTGFDPAFGLQGTCASHVSGFGGWPLGVVIGVDGRPTLVCSAPDQKPGDQGVSPGGRFRGPPATTIRIVSFPANGRPVGQGSNGIVVSIDPPADEPIYLERAITRADRIAVLGGVIRANRQVPTLWVFTPGRSPLESRSGRSSGGSSSRTWPDSRSGVADSGGRPTGMYWSSHRICDGARELGRPPEPDKWGLRLIVDGEDRQRRFRTVSSPSDPTPTSRTASRSRLGSTPFAPTAAAGC